MLQVAPFAAQPGARGGDVAIVQFAYQRVKGRTMVHVPQMRDLVRDGGAADMVGRHRQPPTVAQIAGRGATAPAAARSEEHTSELQSLMRSSYAVLCLKKKN